MHELRFDDRVAVVTGAGRGLGRQHALLLARRGAAVVVNDVRDPRLPEGDSEASRVVAEIRAGGDSAVPCFATVANAEGGEAIVNAAIGSFGRIDIVVNNAGILRDRTFAKLTRDELRAVLDVHLVGAFHVTQPAFRLMREQEYGRIVFTSSASGLFGNFGQSNYGAAKAALVGLSNVLALEGAKYGIKSNVVSPVAATDMTRGTFEEYGGAFDPAYVSPVVAYLASEECEVTGEIFSAGAGQVSRIFVGLSEGIYRENEPFSPEEIAERLPEIRDLEEFIVPESLEDEMGKFLRLMGPVRG